MATPMIKSTYTLDPETVATLEELAGRWRVSKSEALRRTIRAAAARDLGENPPAIVALDRLQRSLELTRAKARRWATGARAERRSASRKRESRKK